MKQLEITIHNETGLHARPAKTLVNLVKKFKSDIVIWNGEKKANAKSLISVLTLGASKGSQLKFEVNGEDEETAVVEIEAAILSGLGEGEAVHSSQTTPSAQKTESTSTEQKPQKENMLRGVGAAPGIAIGPVFHFKRQEISLDEVSSGLVLDWERLQDALARAREQLENLNQQMIEKGLQAEAAIFDAHLGLLDDPELTDAVQTRIQKGQDALKAWKETIEDNAMVVATLNDPILSARADDLRDVGRRVLKLMVGADDKMDVLPDKPVIVVADELSPSDTVSFNKELVLGFCIVNGGPTSHTAILARALGLPAIVSVNESVLKLENDSYIIVDGSDGSLTFNPSPEELQAAEQQRNQWIEKRRVALEQANVPAITADGHEVEVVGNAGSLTDAEKALKMGAAGIGLLRTEFLFLERTTAPTESEQFDVYRPIAETMGKLPVIVRTLDVGGDKPLPYIEMMREENPFLGERGIRLCLNRPELFRQQLRAILRASAHGNLLIMFPMVGDIEEYRQARKMLDELQTELNIPRVSAGIMIEVPSAALMADVLAKEVDFFSIGTNDLTQYTLAMDRMHPALASKQDGLHPAVLRLIAKTIEGAHKHGKWAGICGELGSDPYAVPILIGLGIDELSVNVPSVPLVKAQIRGLNVSELRNLAQQALECSTALEVRELVKKTLSM
ncbi:MAG: phosphoenolpyruvate--protein phosphotransferase [Anaerolineales bacterium]|nr:phosphoenolpyruvate--protein phosphotransferase [Anaerolineales bacterium]MCB9146202.1 phosphoenolpyruvate--protein phosphotransferase [Anaerolineales bacterium]